MTDFSELILLAFRKEAIRKLVFSRPVGDSPLKVTGRLCIHRGQKLLALESELPGNTVSQKNLKEDDISEFLSELFPLFRQVNLITPLGDAELKLSKRGEPVILGAEKLKRRLIDSKQDFERAIEALDKRKNHILSGNEQFLIALGVSDKGGRVHDKRQGKFRQINKFLEYIEEIYPRLPKDGELSVYDLCCGKSYLSFAVYYYLTAIKGRRVYMPAIDIKRDVIEFCAEKARELGFCGMRFIVDDVRNTPTDRAPDLVISLHACDIATDIVLDTAVRLGARVILSTPCCHKALSDRINSQELSFVTKYPKLKGKLCEAITDALRLERLAAYGYEVSATELVDPDDTPKNTLLRAIKVREASQAGLDGYNSALRLVMGDAADDYLNFG